MCLVAIAHRAFERFPLIVAANREEDHLRPTLPADFWPDAPDILGGRDELQGGTWLAISRTGRFAAVTNLRGIPRDPNRRSRGALVSGFVRGETSPNEYVTAIEHQADDYPPFHLYAGRFSRDLSLMSQSAYHLEHGIYALSNAPFGERWPKVDTAEERMRSVGDGSSAGAIADELLAFLSSSPLHHDATRDIFIVGDRYGTRSSTVIVASKDEVLFIERTYNAQGAATGERKFEFRPMMM
jgi:uncharacterized protein with NRDE domain